jgi:hypothetical protein
MSTPYHAKFFAHELTLQRPYDSTGIFHGQRLFTATIEQMSARDSSDTYTYTSVPNTHLVLSELFRAMNTKLAERESAKIRSWANGFPYVNGGLFSDSIDTPRFSKIARSYLLHVGNLDWTKINPDIFGSMIQAVADDEERGALGMHYYEQLNGYQYLKQLDIGYVFYAAPYTEKIIDVLNPKEKTIVHIVIVGFISLNRGPMRC